MLSLRRLSISFLKSSTTCILLDESSGSPTRSDYLELLLRDTTGSHLFELLLRVAPPAVFAAIWDTYFVGRMGKLSVHPVANFVVAKAVGRLGESQLEGLLEEVKGEWRRAVSQSIPPFLFLFTFL